MLDKKAITIKTGVMDFLKMDFKPTARVFIMNPPFDELGIGFIEKVANSMKEGDHMVCIMATDMFSPMELKSMKIPGTFHWLNQRGTFERIEMYRAAMSGVMPKERLAFEGRASTCWFVWEKKKVVERTTKTIIVNAMSEEFDYVLTGKETQIPKEPWDKIKTFVDWDIDNSLLFLQTNKDKFWRPLFEFRLSVVEGTSGIIPKPAGDDGLYAAVVVKDPTYQLDVAKLIDFFGHTREDMTRLRVLYGKRVVTAINHYPLNKEYFRLKPPKEKENNEN